MPMNKGRNTLGLRVQGSWISGYAGEVAPPFDRFYMGGDQDIRGFDIRAISPVVFFPTAVTIPLQNPDGTTVPLDPTNPRRGTWNVTIPVNQIIFPGGDTSWVTQPGIPRADRRAGDAGAVRRHRHGLHHQHSQLQIAPARKC